MVSFTVGPSQVYPTLYKHINKALEENIPSLNHRGFEFKKLFKDTTENLKKLLNIPENFQIFFLSSALECMERVIQSCCEKQSFHIITGAFGKAWATYTSQLGKNVYREVINMENPEVQGFKVPKEREIICITQNDTSTGFWFPMDIIYELKKQNPEKLIAIDVVSSVPFVDTDFKFIDIAFFSVQKGFGLPAGLAIMIVSPKVLEKVEQLIKKGVNIGSYHNLKNLSEKARDLQTPETPNVLNIYLFNFVIKDMLKTGLKKIRQDTEKRAKLLYEFFESHIRFAPFIKNPKFRSPTTLIFDVKGESEKLRKKLADAGYIIGAGYGDNKLNHIRIANFPSHNLKDVKLLLKLI